MKDILFGDYMTYRMGQRGFIRETIEEVLRYSPERYLDLETRRTVAIGSHEGALIMIPFEETATSMIPVTVHAITRQQIRFRLRSGRFTHE